VVGDLYELNLITVPMEWSRPEPSGLAPPPSSKHCCAVCRDHMLIVSGETTWSGHIWALSLRQSTVWFRSTLPDFPLVGASRFALTPCASPRPHKRDEIFIFGGYLEATGGTDSQVLDAFFTLDMSSWQYDEAEVPRETWADVEARLAAAGKDESEIAQGRSDWEDEQKRKQKEILRANRRRARRNILRGERRKGEGRKAGGSGVKRAGDEVASAEEELSDEEFAARADKEFELPPETMPTITFGEWVPMRIGSQLPPPRFGHAMVLAGSSLYVLGGRNQSRSKPLLGDFHLFDCTPLIWKAISYDGDGPGARVSHSLIHLKHFLYVLGGGSGNRSFNDLHRLNLFMMHWELVNTRGAAPGAKPDALIGHSVAWVEPYLVVFAGGDGRRPSNDLHTLELQTAVWRHIDTVGAPPAPRVGHSSTLVGAEMYIIGGFSRGKYFHDVHVLHVETLQWMQAVTFGQPPHGRVSHSATLCDGCIHLFGGSAGGACFNDYMVLTPLTSEAPTTKGALPDESHHASKALTKRAPGQHHAQWTAPEVAGFPPDPRYSHTATALGRMLFIMGGLARKGRAYGDLHALHLSSKEWSRPRVTHESPAPRGRHTMAAVGSVLFLFGGGVGSELYDDVWTLDTDGKGMVQLKQQAAQDAFSGDGVTAKQDMPRSFIAPRSYAAEDEISEMEYLNRDAREANADEVRSWLVHLGLAQHAYTFEAHEIDFEVLLQLQDNDLLDMRIDDPMQRLRLLNGIEVLRARGYLTADGRGPQKRLFRERYRLGAEINFGGQPAFLAVDCKSDIKVAIKFLPDMVEYHRQVALHRELKTESIARMIDSYTPTRQGELNESNTSLKVGWSLPCIVLEYGDCSLADHLSRGRMPAVELRASFEAMVRAVLALHAHGYAHCALQPESFRLYGGTTWRLASLDSVTRIGDATPVKCPVCYAAPEVLVRLRPPGGGASSSSATGSASTAMDVWSLGVLLWQLFSQQPLVVSEVEALTMLPSLRSVDLGLGCVNDLQARHLLPKMLQYDGALRITAQKVLSHGYLTGGLDTVQMDSTFGPMQKGQVFVRSLLVGIAERVHHQSQHWHRHR